MAAEDGGDMTRHLFFHLLFSLCCLQYDNVVVHVCKMLPTLILLSFIWIFLETTLAQYFSPRKSQNVLPRKALTQASGSAVSSEPLQI